MVKKKTKKVAIKNDLNYNQKNKSSNFKKNCKLKFNNKLVFNFLIPVFLILIVMIFGFYVRSGPINLGFLDSKIEQNTYFQIKNFIELDIEQKYPNLNALYKQEMIEKQYNQIINSGEFEYNGVKFQIDKIILENQKQAKLAFKDDNNQTYLTAIDPYHYLRYSQLYQKNGFVGDKLKDDMPYLSYKLAPTGKKGNFIADMQVWIESFLFDLNGIDENSPTGEQTKVIFLIPVFFAILSVIPIFFILKIYSNNLFAFFGSLTLVSIGTFISRTIAGFVDTDAYNVFFPLLIFMFLVYAFLTKNKFLRIFLTLLASLSQVLYLWSWSNGWFIFLFLLIGFIAIFFYDLIKYFYLKFILKDITKIKNFDFKDIKKSGIIFLVFSFFSYLFLYLFLKKNIFSQMILGIFGSVSGIAGISKSNMWPNVLSSVAELNPASFSQIISSVGGKLVFLIAFLGILFLSFDFKLINSKYKILKRIFILFGFFWFLIFIYTNLFKFLTANLEILFLILLFMPIGFGIIFGFFNLPRKRDVFLTIILSIWMAGTIYMSLNGVRFVLLLGPAFAISFAIGLFYLSEILNNFFIKEFEIKKNGYKKLFGSFLMTIFFIILFVPMFIQAKIINENAIPNFDDSWYEAMYKIKNNSNQNAIITSWWDFGHFFTAISQRGVTFDGGSQATPQAYWVGRLFLEENESVSYDILKMLNCGGNQAFEVFFNLTSKNSFDVVKVNKVLDLTFGVNNKRQILENNKYYNLKKEEIDLILEKLDCDMPPENFLITSEDMVAKSGVWAHWGQWDFSKKYIYDNYKKLSVKQISGNIDENQTLVEKYIQELKNIEIKSDLENVKKETLINQWFSDYTSYVPIQNKYLYPCQKENNSIICQNGISYDVFSNKVSFVQDLDVKFKNVVFSGLNNTYRKIQINKEAEFDLVLIQNEFGQLNSLIAQSPLGTSLFTRLFYFKANQISKFELFDSRKSFTGDKIMIWTPSWNKNHSNFNQNLSFN